MNNGGDFTPLAGALSGLCCCFVVFIGLGYLAYRLLFAKKPIDTARFTDRPMPSSNFPAVSSRVGQYGNLISNVTDDGFYIFNNLLSPGAMVHYRYRGPGGWVTRCVPYQPGPQGHYVYVGTQPADVQVVDVVPEGSRDERNYDGDPTLIPGNPQGNYDVVQDSSPVAPSMGQTTNADYPSAY